MRVVAVAFVLCGFLASTSLAQDAEFKSMFNGENLLGWHVSENTESVYVEDGCLVTHGKRAHAFYVGETGSSDFKDFHFKCKVMTKPSANSGVYFHTRYQASGWPTRGYESQVNNTHKDPKKTGGLYGVKDNMEMPAEDNVWFDYEIMVEGKHVIVKVDGKVITDYTEPENPEREEKAKDRLISSGTMALQAHDPGSKVLYKDLMLKILK